MFSLRFYEEIYPYKLFEFNLYQISLSFLTA
jgi:hypothetical protein